MRPALIVVVCVLASGGMAAGLDVTQCQPIPDGQVGVLQADVQCPGPAVNLCNPLSSVRLCTTSADCPPGSQCLLVPGHCFVGARATLQLNGHRILNGGIACFAKPCTVQGPGEVSGAGLGIGISGSTVAVRDLDVHGYTDGIYANRRLKLWNVTSHDNSEHGVRTDRQLYVSNVSLNGNGGSGAFVVEKITGRQVTASGNAGAGIFAYLFNLNGVVATGNGQGGIVAFGRRGRLRDSTITANHLAAAAKPIYGDPFPYPPPVTGDFDVISAIRPSLVRTTCDHSLDFDVQSGAALGPWDICAGD